MKTVPRTANAKALQGKRSKATRTLSKVAQLQLTALSAAKCPIRIILRHAGASAALPVYGYLLTTSFMSRDATVLPCALDHAMKEAACWERSNKQTRD